MVTNRRQFLNYVGATAAVVGASALGLNYMLNSQPETANRAAALVLVNGALIDGTDATRVDDAALVIQSGRIVAVGPRDDVSMPEARSQLIDVQGSTILPGFINAHVHGAYDQDHLAAWAQAGVTTVRDLHARSLPAPYSLRDQTNKEAKYARLVVAGTMITVPGGYPIAVWNAKGLTVTTPEEARQAVNDLLDQGADVIKIALESGEIFGARRLPMLSEDEVTAIVDAAHQRGTLVVAHVSVSKDLKLALDCGVDDIAHMVTDRLPDELISRMVADGTYWEPTLELWKGVGLDGYVVGNLRRYVKAGGKVALGTDYMGAAVPFQLGMPLHEIEWMQEAGMSTMQIITAAAENAAHVCNMSEDWGTLEVGKIADVLVVDGDPLRDLHALSKVRWVIHNGTVIRSPTSGA